MPATSCRWILPGARPPCRGWPASGPDWLLPAAWPGELLPERLHGPRARSADLGLLGQAPERFGANAHRAAVRQRPTAAAFTAPVWRASRG